jgi:hypothetical protein
MPQGKRINTAKKCFYNRYNILIFNFISYLPLNFRTPDPWKGSIF